jgi:hypothetical protein
LPINLHRFRSAITGDHLRRPKAGDQRRGVFPRVGAGIGERAGFAANRIGLVPKRIDGGRALGGSSNLRAYPIEQRLRQVVRKHPEQALIAHHLLDGLLVCGGDCFIRHRATIVGYVEPKRKAWTHYLVHRVEPCLH